MTRLGTVAPVKIAGKSMNKLLLQACIWFLLAISVLLDLVGVVKHELLLVLVLQAVLIGMLILVRKG